MKAPLLLIAAVLAASPALASPAPAPAAPDAEVSIPFVRFGGIRNWEARGDTLVYVQDQDLRWYRVALHGGCPELSFATAIGIDTRGSPSFDRFSAIRVGGELCNVASVTRSGPPPRKPRH